MNNIEYIGLIAAFLTTSSFIPQVYQVFKTKQTNGISLNMYILLFIGLSLWLYYGFKINSISIIIGNSISLFLSSYILIIKYLNIKNNKEI